jgi:hypothetical protein
MDEFDDIDEVGDDQEEVEMVLLDGSSDAGTKLLKFFLGAAIIDGGGKLQISRKALSEFMALCKNKNSFEIWADPDFNDEGIELSLEWHD